MFLPPSLSFVLLTEFLILREAHCVPIVCSRFSIRGATVLHHAFSAKCDERVVATDTCYSSPAMGGGFGYDKDVV